MNITPSPNFVGSGKMSDFIQDQVNKANEESLNRWRKHIEYRISQTNRKLKINRKKRKMERQNKRKARR